MIDAGDPAAASARERNPQTTSPPLPRSTPANLYNRVLLIHHPKPCLRLKTSTQKLCPNFPPPSGFMAGTLSRYIKFSPPSTFRLLTLGFSCLGKLPDRMRKARRAVIFIRLCHRAGQPLDGSRNSPATPTTSGCLRESMDFSWGPSGCSGGRGLGQSRTQG